MEDLDQLREFTEEEVAKHCRADDCWFVLHGLVYDLTPYLTQHPGGSDVLLEVAGKDATTAFEEIGHSNIARRLADKYIVGRVKGATCVRRCYQEKPAKKPVPKVQSSRGSLSTGAVVFAIGLAVCMAVYALQDRLFGST